MEIMLAKRPDSPCIDVCQIDPLTGLCRGCFRTLDEIALWSQLSPMQRLDIMADLPHRQPDVKTAENA